MPFQIGREFAIELDKIDALASYRERFSIPLKKDGAPVIYLCGNSLGLQPRHAADYVQQELEDWARLGVEGHFHARHPWMPYHELLSEQTARLVGALPTEVVNMNTLTVNLHLMMVSFYHPTPQRFKIAIEAHAFPSDRYAVASQVRFHGYDPAEAIVEFPLRDGEVIHHTEDIEAFLEQEGDSIALVLPGGVNYYTGQVFNMERITRKAREKGCRVGYDLAHGAGNIELQLHDWEVDFAVWCTYKYLNAGPGGIAGCFVHEKHHRSPDLPRFAGWWGHDKQTRFRMPDRFSPIPTAEGWQLSNPPILPLAALRASLEIFDEAGMTALRQKSVRLTGYLEFLLKQLSSEGVRILTPKQTEARGCQLSIVVEQHGKTVYERLTEAGVVCDWREPDVIRVAPVPLYNSFTDVYHFVEIFREALQSVK